MIQAKWSPDKGALLKSLRLEADLDVATLARRSIVSTTQLIQLEDGGDSAFYSERIKFSIGKKILKQLGHELNIDESTADSVELEAMDPLISSRGYQRLQADEKVGDQHPTSSKFFGIGQFLVFIFFSASFLIVLLIVTNYLEFSESDKLTTSQSFESEKIIPIQNSLQTSDEVKKNLESDSDLVKSASSNDPCPWDAFEVEITPTAPRKKGDYVHLVANNLSSFCIKVDGQPSSLLKLTAGEEKSIFGRAPFKIYSSDLKSIEIYFQGQLIKLPTSDTKQIKLNAAQVY